MNLLKLLAVFGIGYYIGKNGLPQLPAGTGGNAPVNPDQVVVLDANGNPIVQNRF